jgi:hypothetical protein
LYGQWSAFVGSTVDQETRPVLDFGVFFDDLAGGDGFSYLLHADVQVNALIDGMPGELESTGP